MVLPLFLPFCPYFTQSFALKLCPCPYHNRCLNSNVNCKCKGKVWGQNILCDIRAKGQKGTWAKGQKGKRANSERKPLWKIMKSTIIWNKKTLKFFPCLGNVKLMLTTQRSWSNWIKMKVCDEKKLKFNSKTKENQRPWQ